MSGKRKMKNALAFVRDKSLVVKIDIVIFLS